MPNITFAEALAELTQLKVRLLARADVLFEKAYLQGNVVACLPYADEAIILTKLANQLEKITEQ